MGWTADVKNVTTNGLNIVPTVDLVKSETGEKQTITIPGNNLTNEEIAWQCQRLVELLEDRDAKLGAIKTGIVTLPRDAPAGSPLAVARAARIAADDFFVKLNVLNNLRVQVDKGLLQATDQSVVDARTAVRAAYKPEYQSDSRFR